MQAEDKYTKADDRTLAIRYYNFFNGLFDNEYGVGSLITGIVRVRAIMDLEIIKWLGPGRLEWLETWIGKGTQGRLKMTAGLMIVSVGDNAVRTSGHLLELAELLGKKPRPSMAEALRLLDATPMAELYNKTRTYKDDTLAQGFVGDPPLYAVGLDLSVQA